MSTDVAPGKSLSTSRRVDSGGYTLVVCEKHDAAKRVAYALSSGLPETFRVEGVSAFRLEDVRGRKYVVCSAMGHLYGASDTMKERTVYPALDLEWYPLGATPDRAKSAFSRIRAIKTLSDGAQAFVNACDFDIEGEAIGYNILRYACGAKEASARRARFSTLTKEEIVEAFGDDRLCPTGDLARAGRLRHVIDFVWGVNLSRALSESLKIGRTFRIVSMGRVQGPTLNFVVEKEVDVRTFVPTPYWTATGRFRRGDIVFEAKHSSPQVMATRDAAEEARNDCEGREGSVSVVATTTVNRRPPPPFDLADLQKEAFKLFRYPPSKTLRIAERLYLRGIVSYPRTGSQRLPRIDYAELLSKIGAIPRYSDFVNQIISQGVPSPVEGGKTDSAHPAIYPTGEVPSRPLPADEIRVFDLIVRRFLSCLGEDAVDEMRLVEVSVGRHVFRAEETRTLFPGWMKFAAAGLQRRPVHRQPGAISALQKDDCVNVETVAVEERTTVHPERYNEVTLLEKMEQQSIGTKATRADIISTLSARGYVVGERLIPTGLGFSLVEVMRDYCPQIISTGLTREIEAQLDGIENSEDFGYGFFEKIISVLMTQIVEVRLHEGEIASKMLESTPGKNLNRLVLGDCPVCKKGELQVVRSSKSGKRFVGCTEYVRGCVASAPLPQRGVITPHSKPCSVCGWPVVRVGFGRRSWRLCVNDRCPRKVNVYAMQVSRKDGKRMRRFGVREKHKRVVYTRRLSRRLFQSGSAVD